MKCLIFGTGKVSAHLLVDADYITVPHSACDIADIASIRDYIKKYDPDVVINCAAKTNLEYCQENKEESYRTNTLGVINLLHSCSQGNIKFVHISSGCLFDGNEAVSTEESIPTPAAWYTYTKAWADAYIENYGYDNYLILRPRQMISAIEHPTNMLTKFSKYGVIHAHKELNSLTCVEDFSEMMRHLLHVGATGTFNCCNEDLVTPYEIAVGVRDYIESSLEVHEADYEYTLTLQPNRRVNTILSNEKLKNTGYIPRTAQDALKWCLQNYRKQL